MEIYINDKKTSFQLENEKNALDIINAVGDFAAKLKPQHFITSIIIDNKEFSYADEKKLNNMLIENIEKFEIETEDIFGITALSLNQIEKFINLLKSLIKENQLYENFDKTNDSIKWMQEGINQIYLIFDFKDENILSLKDLFIEKCKNLSSILFNISSENIDDQIIDDAMIFLNQLSTILNELKEWLVKKYNLPDNDYVEKNLYELVEKINKILPQLENIPILFQTGDDNEAMNIIKNLTTILEESISLFLIFKETFKLHMDKYTVKEVSFEAFFKVITDHLKDLMDAIQNSDSVMISDLLEYEFVPNLEEIKNILTKIKDEAFTKAN